MSQIRPRLPVVGLLARSAVIPAVLLIATNMVMVMFIPVVHMVVVGVAGVLAASCAIAMSVIAARRNDGRAVWIGMAFSVIATMLVIHGLATPGVILPDNGLVQVAGALNLPVCGAILAASGLPMLRRPRRVRLLLRIQFLVVAALAIAGAAALVFAQLIPVVPDPSTVTAELIFGFGAIPLVLLAWRAGRTYLLTRRVSDLIVVEGIVWLTAAQFGLLNFTMMNAAWWAAHGLEVGGIGMVAIPVALDLRHAVASRPLVGDLRAADLVEHEEAFLGGRVRALLVRLGEKDPSTEGHTRRVATLAVAIGERLDLPEGRLRQLASGWPAARRGKLSVPNEILNKPGRLTDEEFDEIRRHPGAGRRLLTELGGFSPSCSTSSRATTSGWTPAAIPTACRPATSTSRPGSSPSPTSTTHSPRIACTARLGRPSGRWPCSTTRRAAPSTPSAWPPSAGSLRPNSLLSARRRRAGSQTPRPFVPGRPPCSAKRPRKRRASIDHWQTPSWTCTARGSDGYATRVLDCKHC